MKIWWFCFIIFFVFAGVNLANPITPEDVQKATKNLDYKKTKTIRMPDIQESDKQIDEEKKNESFSGAGEFVGLIFKWIIYIVIANIVILLLYFIFKNTNWKIEPKQNTEIVEVNEKREKQPQNYLTELDEALAKGDGKMIVRLRYLIILQSLHEKKKIKLEKGKTNRGYARELRGALRDPFIQLVQLFEKSWYGNYEVKEEQLHASGEWYQQIYTILHE